MHKYAIAALPYNRDAFAKVWSDGLQEGLQGHMRAESLTLSLTKALFRSHLI